MSNKERTIKAIKEQAKTQGIVWLASLPTNTRRYLANNLVRMGCNQAEINSYFENNISHLDLAFYRD